MALSQQWLDELRARITLSDVIGRHVKLQRAGREYKGCCPFHHEKTPSFTINDEKGFYHCFGCGAHGDVIRFLTDNRGLGFMDAVRQLASEAGMQLPAPDPAAAQKAQKRATLHDAMQAAQNWFVHNLQDNIGEGARNYLQRRGISAKTAHDFGFGYAPDSRQAIGRALASLEPKQLIEAGLLISVDGKTPYDRFRGRLMIPIRDARGRVIAFGGRILGDGEPKYLNSPDTPLFDKGRTLYNLDRAAPAARQSGRIIVVEGYMDAIALSAAGFADVVAPLGTALTETQLALLWKQAEAPLLCFDGDAPGKRAALRAIGRALPQLRPGYSLRIITLPGGMDPDDLIRSQGPQGFAAQLDKAVHLLDWLWQYELQASPLETPEARAGLKKRMLDHCDTIEDADIKALYRREVQQRFSDRFFSNNRSGFRSDGGSNRFAPPGRGAYGGKGSARPRWQEPHRPGAELRRYQASQQEDLLMRAILSGLVLHPHLIGQHIELLSNFRPASADHDALLQYLLEQAGSADGLSAEELQQRLQSGPLAGAWRKLKAQQLPQFSFCHSKTPAKQGSEDGEPAPDHSADDMAEALELLVARPLLEAELRHVTHLFEQEASEEQYARQQQLHRELSDFDMRLRSLLEDRR